MIKNCFYCPTLLNNKPLTLDFDDIFSYGCPTCSTEYHVKDNDIIKVIVDYPNTNKIKYRLIYYPISGCTLLQKLSSSIYDYRWITINEMPNYFLKDKTIPEIYKKINTYLIFN